MAVGLSLPLCNFTGSLICTCVCVGGGMLPLEAETASCELDNDIKFFF